MPEIWRLNWRGWQLESSSSVFATHCVQPPLHAPVQEGRAGRDAVVNGRVKRLIGEVREVRIASPESP